MAGAGRMLGVLGGLVVAAVAAGVWLVLSDSGTEDAPDETPAETNGAAPDKTRKDPVQTTKGTRKKAKVLGDATVFGTVKRRQGSAPAVGQEVLLKRADADPWTVAVDQGGSFKIAELPDGGPYELVVECKGFATIRLPGLVLTKGEQRDVGTLWLDQAVPVTVSVQTWGGEPIEGAQVEAFAAPDWSRGNFDWTKAWAQLAATPVAVATQATDAKGKASFPEMASGMWSFTARKDGFGRDGRTNVRLEGGTVAPEVKIFLPTGHALKGRVLDGDKRPIAGVLVLGGRSANVWDFGSAPLRARSTTDDAGRYELTGLPSGDIALMTAPKGGAPAQAATVRVPNITEYDLYLRSGGKLEGTVTESGTGKPVEGATVRIQSSRMVEATTDAAGKYVIAAVPDGPVNDVQATKDGWMQDRRDDPPQGRVLQLYPGDSATRDVKMRQGAKVTGIVRSTAGPLSGARVSIWVQTPDRGVQSSKAAVTDAEGKYEIAPIEKGKGMIQVAKEGYLQPGLSENWWMALQQGNVPPQFKVDVPETGEAKLDIELTAGSTIEGKVETAEGPVADATVNLWSSNGQQTTAKTGADGTFSLVGGAPGSKVTLYPMKEGYVSGQNEPVSVLEGQPTTGVVLKLVKQKIIRGKVASGASLPLKDAQVTVVMKQQGGQQNEINYWTPDMQWGGQQAASPVRSDGSFEVTVPWLTGTVAIRAQAIDHAAGESPHVVLQESQQEYEANVVLEPGYTIRGRVSSKGAGVQGADITFAGARGQPGGMGGGNTIVAVTNSEGVFTIEHVQTGTYTVTASADGFVAKSQGDVKVPTAGDVSIELEQGIEISGKVMFADGRAAAGAVIQAQKDEPAASANPRSRSGRWGGNMGGSGQAYSGQDGSFRIRNLASGAYKLNVSPPWDGSVNFKARTTEPVTAGTTDYKLVVEGGGVIAGRVLDAAKAGVAMSWVYANPVKPDPANPMSSMGRNARTKPDGSFEITGLGDGPYNLGAQVPQTGESSNLMPASLQNIAVGTRDLQIVLESGLTIEGVVVDAQGKPLAEAYLYVQGRPDPQGKQPTINGNNSQTTSGTDGRFRFQGLGPGRFNVTMYAWQGSRHDGLFATGGEDIASGSTDVRLVATTGDKIAGVVVDEGGQSLPNVWVNANPANGMGRGKQTDKDGKFEITGLPRGTVNVSVSTQGRPPVNIEKVETGTLVLRIVMAKGASVAGRALDASGSPLANTWLQFRQTDGGKHNGGAQTNADGRFNAENLIEGTYDVYASRPKADNPQQWEQVKLGSVRTGETSAELRIP